MFQVAVLVCIQNTNMLLIQHTKLTKDQGQEQVRSCILQASISFGFPKIGVQICIQYKIKQCNQRYCNLQMHLNFHVIQFNAVKYRVSVFIIFSYLQYILVIQSLILRHQLLLDANVPINILVLPFLGTIDSRKSTGSRRSNESSYSSSSKIRLISFT